MNLKYRLIAAFEILIFEEGKTASEQKAGYYQE
jgi:hypothetical protein